MPAIPYISLLRRVREACIMKYTHSLHIQAADICLDSLGMDIYNCSWFALTIIVNKLFYYQNGLFIILPSGKEAFL